MRLLTENIDHGRPAYDVESENPLDWLSTDSEKLQGTDAYSDDPIWSAQHHDEQRRYQGDEAQHYPTT